MNTFLSDLVPGKDLSVFSKGAQRPATVLAIHNNQMLIEYRFPGGTTALLCFDLAGDLEEESWWGRNRQYKTISLAWLQAMEEGGISWTGKPQQHALIRWPIPPAALLLQQRKFRAFWSHGEGTQFLTRARNHGKRNISSWSKEGSSIAAMAILTWIRLSAKPDNEPIQAHLVTLNDPHDGGTRFFVSVVDAWGEWYIDTFGVRAKDALLQQWSLREVPGEMSYGEEEAHFQRMDLPHDPAISREITSSLLEKVGAFSPGLLFSTYVPRARVRKGKKVRPTTQRREAA